MATASTRGGPTKESYMESSTERTDQIVRVDASALLRTIRDLEYKLTEQQKTDKPPAWAVALEQRIEQMENTFFSAQSKLPGDLSAASDGQFQQNGQTLAGSHSDNQNVDTTSIDHAVASPAKPPVQGDHNEEEGQKKSVVDFATEMRVVSKVRKEIDLKFHTAELHLESKMASFNLQLDRLMKLLQIRPTTSELQTVMNAVYDVDKKVMNSMEEIKNDMRAQLKSHLSEEIASIIDEVKEANNLSETGLKYMQSTVDSYSSTLTDLREVTENTVVMMNEAVSKLQHHNTDLEDNIAKMKFQLERQIQEQVGEIATLKAEQAVLQEEFKAYRTKTEEEIMRVTMQMAEDKAKFMEEIARVDYEAVQASQRIADNAAQLLQQQSKAEADLAAQAKVNKSTQETLADYAGRLDKLRKDVDVLVAYDTPAKVADLQAEIAKSNINILGCQEAIEKYINGDLKALNVKVSLLQEQCNIQIPAAYGEMSMRIDTLSEQLLSSNTAIDKTMLRLQATDDTVGELMPLLDRVATLETHSGSHLHELQNLKETLTSTIDTTDELVRRLEETEETVEGLETSVTNRMNQMRDALIDTILEKQAETNNAMRNVRENLEVMARAGEGPVTAAAVGQLTAPGVRSNASMPSSASSKSNMSGGQSAKVNPPVSIAVPGQGQGQAAQGQSAAAGVPAPTASSSPVQGQSNQSNKGGGAGGGQGNRKQSGMGIRANISSEMSDSIGPDDYGSNVSLGSGSQDANGFQQRGVVVAGYHRPSMAGQEIRGSAAPTLVRQSSNVGVTGPTPNISLARQLSSKLSVSESAPVLSTHVPQPRLSTPPPAQRPYPANNNAFDLDVSPDPDGYSRTMTPDHFGRQSPSPRVSTAPGTASSGQRSAPASAPSQQQMQCQQPAPTYQAPMPAPVTSVQPAPVQRSAPSSAPTSVTQAPQSAPVQQLQQQQLQAQPQSGYVRYVPPPQPEPVLRHQIHPTYQRAPGVMDSLDPNDALYVPQDYPHFQQAQFLADLCLNFEEISVKRKRVANVPTVMCESIADVTQDIAEYMARAADFEMVQYMLSSVAGLTSAQDVNYDENLVLTKRNQKIEEYLASMTNLIILTSRNQQPGIIRTDARSLFVSLVKKGLDMFMSKHNQVLVVGNSRLGRVKIPSCLACDRPLIDKVRLDSAMSRGGTRSHDFTTSQSQYSAGVPHPSQHLIQGLSGFHNPSVASYGYGAPPETTMNDEEEPLSPLPGVLAPINQRKPTTAGGGNPCKRSAHDGKLPEVQ